MNRIVIEQASNGFVVTNFFKEGSEMTTTIFSTLPEVLNSITAQLGVVPAPTSSAII